MEMEGANNGGENTKSGNQAIQHPDGPPPPLIVNQDLQNEQEHHHPLLNELILENVFKYVNAWALPQARLVNTSWYDASLPPWRKEGLPIVLCLEDDPTHVFPYWKRHARKPIPMKHFIQSLEGYGREEEEVEKEGACGSPVARRRGIKQHSVFELRAQAQPQPAYNLLESFWNQVGDQLTKLTLWDFFFPDLELVREVVLCRRTPNLESLDVLITMGQMLLDNKQVLAVQGEHVKLKTLKIGMLRREGEASGSWGLSLVTFPFSWDALLNYYPKLESLTLHPAEKYMDKWVTSCLTAIRALRSDDDGKLASLKELSWFDEDYFSYKSACGQPWDFSYDGYFGLSWGFLNLLMDCNLRLTSFGMLRPHESSGLEGSIFLESNNRRVSDALATYRDSLRKFTYFQRRPGAGLLLKGVLPPDMPQLRYLCLKGSSSPTDMTFLRNVPSSVTTLKILEFGWNLTDSRRNAISRTKQRKMRGVVLSSLKTFCFPYLDNDWTRGDIARLAGWMPNITRLELELTNEGFRAVCESFPNLEHMRVFGEKLGDKGIAGEIEQVVEVEGGRRRRQEVVYEKPNLSSLHKLTSFVIDNPFDQDQQDQNERITEVSVRHGFFKLPHLERLILKTNWLVTPEAKSLLEGRIHFAKVARTVFLFPTPWNRVILKPKPPA